MTLKSSMEVCRDLGITYRQLDYWIRVGYVTCSWAEQGSGRPIPAPTNRLDNYSGSGAVRRFDAVQVDRLREIRDAFRKADAILWKAGIAPADNHGASARRAGRSA